MLDQFLCLKYCSCKFLFNMNLQKINEKRWV